MYWTQPTINEMPLDDIVAEMRRIEAKPVGNRTVNDVERLNQLEQAARRIRHKGRRWI